MSRRPRAPDGLDDAIRCRECGRSVDEFTAIASDRLDEPAESFRDEVGSRDVAALFIDDDLGVGHVVSEPLAMLARHEHVGQAERMRVGTRISVTSKPQGWIRQRVSST